MASVAVSAIIGPHYNISKKLFPPGSIPRFRCFHAAAVAWLCLDITTPIQSACFRLARRRFGLAFIAASNGDRIFS